MDTPVSFERDGHTYLIGKVTPMDAPTGDELAELAFADTIRGQAPSEKLLWLKGQYVEGDSSNRNGQGWKSGELAIKSLQPRLMPVTEMHDPRTAVGLIADTKLLTPERDGVPRTRIDTVLAIWAHRFPEVAKEIAVNYQQGTLMQSMECDAPAYECADCGQEFVKLPGDAERAGWCGHLKSALESRSAPKRTLLNVQFTGTGLIFGTRNGAVGALDTAHLDAFEGEVAEFHQRAQAPTSHRSTPVDEITIKRSEYDELKASAGRVDDLTRKVTSLEGELSSSRETASKVDKLEIDLKAATDTATAEKARADGLEEGTRAGELSEQRMGKLGSEFVAKLPESVKTRLSEQSKALSDEDWTARLDEIAEMTGVKADAIAPASASGSVSAAETSRSGFGSGPATGSEPSVAARTTVMSGLFRSLRPDTPKSGE